MALRLASRRAAIILNGSVSVSATSTFGAKISSRNATAVAVPTPAPVDEIKDSILVKST